MKFRTKLLPVVLLPMLMGGCADFNNLLNDMNHKLADLSPKPEHVNLNQICRDFDENPIMAQRKWNGKYITTSGVIDGINYDALDRLSLGIKTRGILLNAMEVTGIDVSQLKNGQYIHAKGYLFLPDPYCNITIENTVISR